ncbi:maleylpyruvate isomerase family mycothiol-dependent enzyme [Gulosibacter chungangensis]|uniref:maleylpyruvate isomerase family mycothiol-dependent enzyme n=1 Tax=Gulosibacter chungangensis TaxID=979746 RepID=UPI001788152B|nr:maleylpyruvate isomerase family mycothiol-dependent enzyme [Gulosibacter chungangensis]
MTTPIEPEHLPVNDETFSRPTKKSTGDWSAHIATTLERLAEVLETLTPEQWDAQSLCSEWRVRDVVGHIIWRVGEANGTMLRTGLRAIGRGGFRFSKVVATIGVEHGDGSPEELIARLHEIAAAKLQGEGRTGFIELIEAVVHSYDITEALDIPLRLSPRSTGAIARAQANAVPGNKHTRIARTNSLRATDARWLVGTGSPIDATAGEILMHLFGRRSLV